jgi:hypothetical protein
VYANGECVRGSLEGFQSFGCVVGEGGGGGGVKVDFGECGECGEGGPSMSTTFSLRVLLRGGSPKNVEINKLSERLCFLGSGLSSPHSMHDERLDGEGDCGGLLSCVIINSDVGSP